MSVNSSNNKENILKVSKDESLAISGVSPSAYEDKSADEDRQKKLKSADYDGKELLSNALGYTLDSGFKKSIELQSKKPLYALENPGFWTTKDIETTIKIEPAYDSITLLNKFKNDIQCYSRDIETISNRENSVLQYIVLTTSNIEKTNSSGSNDELSILQDDNFSVTYMFKSKINGIEKIDVIKNSITSSNIDKGFYRAFTVCNQPIVKWSETNGQTKKYLVNPNNKISNIYPIKFSIGDLKPKISILIDVENIGVLINIIDLQKKILAVQTIKPKIEQLKKDLSPSWVAKRIDYNKFPVASEDVTLTDGTSYYWDVGQCWKVRENDKDLMHSSEAAGDSNSSAWYWELEPMLKGGDNRFSKNDKYKQYYIEKTDVTSFNSGDAETFNVNVTPDKIAKKAYAMIIDDPDFVDSDFITGGQKGIYFQHSNANMITTVDENNNTKVLISDSMKTNLSKNDGFVHPADKNGKCFYNDDINTPNNGLLIEAKDKIFDVYFLTKDSYANDEASMQYEIRETLKNGYQTSNDENRTKTPYTALYYKQCIDGGNEDEIKLYQSILQKAKEDEENKISSGVIEQFTLTKEDLNTTRKVDGNDIKIYDGLTIGQTYYRYNQDKNKLPNDLKECYGLIYDKVDEDEEYLNILETLPLTKHFTYHESNELIQSNGSLIQSEYLLAFGYGQERITTFTKIYNLFKETFAKFNKNAIPYSVIENFPGYIPWWRQEGEYILLNKKFVEIFFGLNSSKKKSNLDLVPVNIYEDDETSWMKDSISDYDFDFVLTEDDISKLNKEIAKEVASDEFSKKFIDSKVDYICDKFYEMVCNVWGKTCSDGTRRTKGYFVQGTPFEITETTTSDGKTKYAGFDARALIDYLIAKDFSAAYERISVRLTMQKIEGFFKKNPNIDLAIEENYKNLIAVINESYFDIIMAMAKVDRFAEEDPLREEKQKISQKNKTNRLVQNIGHGIIAGQITIAGIALGVVVGIKIFSAITAAAAAATAATAATAAATAGTAGAAATVGAGALGSVLAGAGGTLTAALAAVGVGLVIVAVAAAIGYALYFGSRNLYDKKLISDDYVYKFTCRAKRALRQYTITKRGPLVGEKEVAIEDGKEYKYGDANRRNCYYNWLAENGHKQPTGNSSEVQWDFDTVDVSGNKESLLSGNVMSFSEPYDGRVMVIIPTTDEVIGEDESDSNGYALQKIEQFIQTWMGKQKNEVTTQAELPIQGYYDFLSGMHPWIEAKFRMGLGTCGRKKTKDGYAFYNENGHVFMFKNGNKYYKPTKDSAGDIVPGDTIDDKEAEKQAADNFRSINSRDYPYFKNLSIVDNGIKKLKLTLFDPNFASYTTGIKTFNDSDNSVESESLGTTVISLEALIRGALRSPVFFQDETIDKYDGSAGEIGNNYLTIDESLTSSPTNLKIRYGYDDNDNLKECDTYFQDDNGNSRSINRDGRWWNAKKWGTTSEHHINQMKKYIQDGKIENASGIWTDYEINSQESIYNSKDQDINHSDMVKSWAQTTAKSRETDYMITKFKSTLQQSGIEYEIEAIESKDANVMRTRFLQRYAEITANPEEVLYILMHMFNEDYNGDNITGSKVKIILISDDSDKDVPVMRDKLNMEYDFKNIKEDMLDGTEAQSIYEKAYQDEELEIKEELLKKITITLGGASATKNYGNSKELYKPVYKTLAQLMNEFCAACPPKKLMNKRENVTDENGNNVLSNQDSTTARPLKWFSMYDKVNDITYVCLYYRTVIKIPKIRVYTWGPNNPTPSCVKKISITNANEFGVLSGIRSFDGQKKRSISRMNTVENNIKENEVQETVSKNEYKNDGVYGTADYVGVNARNYDDAYASCMYTGTIEILGDPFWSFDGLMQPCTMPIKLNVVMPQSEFTRQVDDESCTYSEYKNQITNLRNTFNSRETEANYWYNQGWDLVYNKDTGLWKTREYDNVKVHQAFHEMSGYYVVQEIQHNINANGYTTTLKIMSYPNIQKDVLNK